jgi:hypothetical protein
MNTFRILSCTPFCPQDSLNSSGTWTLQGIGSVPQGCWPMLTPMLPNSCQVGWKAPTTSDAAFDTRAPRHALKSLSSLLRSSVPMLVYFYQKHVINDVRNFVLSISHLIGLVLVSVEDKTAIICYSVCDVIYNNLAVLIYFDQQVPLVYTVLIKASSNEPILNIIGWKYSVLQKPVSPSLSTTIPRSNTLRSFVLHIHPLHGTHTQSMSTFFQGLKIL